jgi:hypothetical protein
VAHVAAESGRLPPNFDQWTLANKDGWTVAHEAAKWGHIPRGFDMWDVGDVFGITVAKVAMRNKFLTQQEYAEWKAGKAIRDVMASSSNNYTEVGML